MAELAAASAPLQRMLDPRTAMELGEAKAAPTEAAFRWQRNEDAMATEKLAEGIRKFAEDTQKLQAFLHRRAGE